MNVILAHLIGDYILQTDWMATEKKKSWYAAGMHTLFYLIPFIFCGLTGTQVLLIGLQHALQDRTNFVVWFMKAKGSGDFATGPCSPWSIIVTDNILHVCWISFIIWVGGLA